MLYIVYAYFLFKIKNFYKKKEPIPSGMSPSKESDSFLKKKFYGQNNHIEYAIFISNKEDAYV